MRALVPVLFCLLLGASVLLLLEPDQALRWDNLVHNLPLTLESFRQLSAGRLPAWNPYLWSGSPLLADPQSQAFYPPTLIAYALAGARPAAAFPLLYAMHVAIAAGGTYLLARTLGTTVAGGLLAATVFTMNPFTAFLATSFANEVAVLAWLPWTAWAALRAADGDRPLAALGGGAVAAALAWTGGYPQLWVYSLGAIVVLAAGAAARPGRAVLLAGAIGLAGLALSLWQVLPFLSLWETSQRADPRSLDEFLRTDVPLASWPAIFLPGLVGSVVTAVPLAENNWPHLGLCAVTLALIALLRPGRARLVLLGIAAAALWLASGRSGGLLPLLYEWVPGLGFLRGPYKFYPYATFAIALLAGLGLGDVERAPRGLHAAVLGAAALLGLLGPALRPEIPAYVLEAAGRLSFHAAVAGIAGTLLVAVAVLLAAASSHGRGGTTIGALALAATLAGFAPELAIYAQASPLGQPLVPPSQAFAETRRSLRADARWHWGVDLLARPLRPDLRRALGTYWQLEMSTGYSAFLDTGYARAIGQDAATVPLVTPDAPGPLDGRNRVLDVLATPHVLVRADEDLLRWLTRRWLGDGGPIHVSGSPVDDLYLLIRRRTLPRVRAVPRVDAVATRDDAILPVQKGTIEPLHVALVEEPFAAAGPRSPCTIGKTRRDADRVRTVATCKGDGFLVFAERWDPGWSAFVDGRPAPLVRAYGLVLGVPVPAGRHQVVVRYAPPGFATGVIASAAAAALLVLLAAVEAWRRRTRPA